MGLLRRLQQAADPFGRLGRGHVAELVPESVKRVYLSGMDPVVRGLLQLGVTPNTLTTIGAIVILASAVAYGVGSIRLGGVLLLLSGMVDTLDGQVARASAQTTKFGAFYDSTLDRVGDGATFIGIAAYLAEAPDVQWRELAVIACMLGILSTSLVSYMRARAEGLGLSGKVGMVQRAERIIGLGLTTAILGAGAGGVVLTAIVVVLTVLSFITVGQRFAHVRREAAAVDVK
ncbi:MAG: CDP-alcohol phosphatidyltransferase family protein [Gemmatimonadota bacterium]